MTIACTFGYSKPQTVEEALRLLARRVGGGIMPLAGGTDLVAWLRDGAVSPGHLVDIKSLKELHGIRLVKGGLWLGACTTFSELAESPLVRRHAPILTEAAGMVASVGIRNRATVAGNICSAVPCCDSGPVLLVYDAQLHLATRQGPRTMPIARWFKGPRATALPKGAILVGISIPTGRHAGAFAKLKRYRGEDLAQASVAVRVDSRGNWQVAYGSVAPTPLRGPKVEKLLKGRKQPEADLIEQAVKIGDTEIAPITDIRGSEVYRRMMVGVMLRRTIALAARRLAGEGPDYGINILEEEAS